MGVHIDVIMVSWNSAGTIGYAIESFLAQSYADKHLIVVDGGSADGTQEIVRAFNSPLITIISEQDQGIYDAMNKGLAISSGDAVGFLNSDDAFHSAGALAAIAEGLRDADVVYGDIYLVRDHATKHVVRFWKSGEYPVHGFRHGWVPPHPTFYVRKSIADTVKAFDLRYQGAADYDFMLRATLVPGIRIHYVRDVLVDFKIGGYGTASWRRVITNGIECLQSRRRNFGHGFVDRAFFVRYALRLREFGRAARIRRVLRRGGASRL